MCGGWSGGGATSGYEWIRVVWLCARVYRCARARNARSSSAPHLQILKKGRRGCVESFIGDIFGQLVRGQLDVDRAQMLGGGSRGSQNNGWRIEDAEH